MLRIEVPLHHVGSPVMSIQNGHRHVMQRRIMMQDDMDAELEAAEAAARAATKAAAEAAAEKERQAEMRPGFDVRSLAGISPPLGFWDPVGFSDDIPETKLRCGSALFLCAYTVCVMTRDNPNLSRIVTTPVRVPSCRNRFYREVEVKHSRVAMLAAVGFPLAEHWHPLWGGTIDVPSYVAFQATPLQTFWPVVVSAIGVVETFSVFTFERPYDLFYSGSGGFWNIRADHPPGDLRFDPLNLMPSDPADRLEMETKELNHGRLAMFGIVGMVVQELVTGEKLW